MLIPTSENEAFITVFTACVSQFLNTFVCMTMAENNTIGKNEEVKISIKIV